MHVLADRVAFGDRGDHGLAKVLRVRACEPDPLNAGHCVAGTKQLTELGLDVGREVPVRSAISVLGTPSAANNTIRALVANPARTLEARVNASSRPRSPSRSSNASATYTEQLSQPAKRKCFTDTQH